MHVRCRRLVCLGQRPPTRFLLLAQCLLAPAGRGRHRRIVRVDALLFLERPALDDLRPRHAALARARRLEVRLWHAELAERLFRRGLLRPPRALVRVHRSGALATARGRGHALTQSVLRLRFLEMHRRVCLGVIYVSVVPNRYT